MSGNFANVIQKINEDIVMFSNRIKNADENLAFVTTPNMVGNYNYVHRLYESYLKNLSPDVCATVGGIQCMNLKFLKRNVNNGTLFENLSRLLNNIDTSPIELSNSVRDDFLNNIQAIQKVFSETLNEKSEQIGRLMSSVNELTREVAVYRGSAEPPKSENELRNEQRLNLLRGELDISRKITDDYRKIIIDTNGALESIRGELEIVRGLSTSRQAIIEKNGDIINRLTTLANDISNDLKLTRNKYDVLVKNYQDARASETIGMSTVTDLKSEIDLLKRQLDECRVVREAAESERTVLLSRLNERMDVGSTDYFNMYNSTKDRLDLLSQDFDHCRIEVANLQSENERLTNENQRLLDEQQRVVVSVPSQNDQVQQLANEIENLNRALAECRSNNEEILNGLSTANLKLQEREIEVSRQENEIVRIRNELLVNAQIVSGDTDARFNSSIMLVEQLKLENSNVIRELESCRSRMLELSEINRNLENKYADCAAEVQRLKRSLRTDSLKRNSNVGQGKSTLNKLKNRIKILESKLEKSKLEFEASRNANAAAASTTTVVATDEGTTITATTTTRTNDGNLSTARDNPLYPGSLGNIEHLPNIVEWIENMVQAYPKFDETDQVSFDVYFLNSAFGPTLVNIVRKYSQNTNLYNSLLRNIFNQYYIPVNNKEQLIKSYRGSFKGFYLVLDNSR